MNSRERVRAALEHREPDRIPIDLGGLGSTGMAAGAYARIRRLLDLPADRVQVYEVFGMMARIEPDVMSRFGVDTVLVPPLCPRFGIPITEWKPWTLLDGTPVLVPAEFHTVEEPDGSLLLWVGGKAVAKMPRDGYYFSELANATMGDFDSLSTPPDPDTVEFPLLRDEDLRFRQDTARTLYESTDKALVVDLLDNMRWTPSIPEWLLGLAAWPDRAAELHAKRAEALIQNTRLLAEAVGPYVQVFAMYQDLGTQDRELVSPTTFHRLIAPHYRRVFDWVHRHTQWKVLYHSCGSIYRLIPDIIDMGVDILNPVQCSAAGMDPRRLKAEFGDRLVFWGGGVDTQTVLPFGTTDEVRAQVRERIRAFGPGGGYVFTPTQDIQNDVPPENVLAMYEAVQEYGLT